MTTTPVPPPARWLVLTAAAPADDPLRDLLAEGLLALGGLGIVDEGEALTVYLDPAAGEVATFLEGVRAFLADWTADEAPELSWRWQENEDWEREWRRGLRPRKVSRRLVVKPSWTSWVAAPDEVIIDIDPQMAFGTGEHATTRGCLRLLDGVMDDGARVLDIGSGSAILSIAAAKLGASRVIAVEYDPDANLNARENIARNSVEDRVELREELAGPDLIAGLGRFDVVLANILSGVIRPLLPSLAGSLEDRGRLIVSGILRHEREGVVEDASDAGLVLLTEDVEEEWWSGMFGPD